MKIIAETTGDFMLSDPQGGGTLYSSRPGVISVTGFVTSRISLGQVVKLADVGEEATDDEFAGYWKEAAGDRDLAVSSYASKFDGSAEPAKPATKRGK